MRASRGTEHAEGPATLGAPQSTHAPEPHMPRSSRAPLAALLLALLSAPSAMADSFGPKAGDDYINPGLLLGGSYRPSGPVFGLGAELSYHHFTDNNSHGVGGFIQWQAMNFQYHRFCGGMQATGDIDTLPVGAELGLTYETAGGDEAATTSLLFAPFVSLGAATASLRFSIPIAGGSDEVPHHGFDVGLSLALKIPQKLPGRSPSAYR